MSQRAIVRERRIYNFPDVWYNFNMKKIIVTTLCLLMFFGSFNLTNAKVIYETGQPNIMITSPEIVTSKRNTELKWTWLTLKNTEKVDIYLISNNKKYAFAKDYPNTGNFWWATGFTYTEWKLKLKNSESEIAVCPAGNKKIDQACGIFTVNIFGDVPVLKIISPKGGSKFSSRDTMQVSFSGAKVGERYKINLLYPAKVSPIETLLGKVIADVSGKESFEFIVPNNLTKGIYTVGVIQETNEGSCLNVCAQTESKPIRIK